MYPPTSRDCADLFDSFHTLIPGKAQDERTFIILPAKKEAKLAKRFSPNKNDKAANEVDA